MMSSPHGLHCTEALIAPHQPAAVTSLLAHATVVVIVVQKVTTDRVCEEAVQAGTSETAVKVVLVLQNLVFLIFMASLAWIFRSSLTPPITSSTNTLCVISDLRNGH